MKRPKKEIYGQLAVLRLLQMAAYDDTLNDRAVRILAILAGHADQVGTCFPSVSKIAKQIGISRAAVSKQITTLIKHSYIQREAKFCKKTHARHTNLYTFNLQLANDFDSADFSEKGLTPVVAYLATLLGYNPLQLNTVAYSDTQSSCINKTQKTNHIEENKKQKNEPAHVWPKSRLEILRDALHKHYKSKKMTDIGLKIQSQVNHLPANEQELEAIKLYEMELDAITIQNDVRGAVEK